MSGKFGLLGNQNKKQSIDVQDNDHNNKDFRKSLMASFVWMRLRCVSDNMTQLLCLIQLKWWCVALLLNSMDIAVGVDCIFIVGWTVVERVQRLFGGKYESALLIKYLRPVSGCINAGCAAVVAVLGCGFGLLTFVLLFANSKRIVWGISGSKRTPCCNCQCILRSERDREIGFCRSVTHNRRYIRGSR